MNKKSENCADLSCVKSRDTEIGNVKDVDTLFIVNSKLVIVCLEIILKLTIETLEKGVQYVQS